MQLHVFEVWVCNILAKGNYHKKIILHLKFYMVFVVHRFWQKCGKNMNKHTWAIIFNIKLFGEILPQNLVNPLCYFTKCFHLLIGWWNWLLWERDDCIIQRREKSVDSNSGVFPISFVQFRHWNYIQSRLFSLEKLSQTNI